MAASSKTDDQLYDGLAALGVGFAFLCEMHWIYGNYPDLDPQLRGGLFLFLLVPILGLTLRWAGRCFRDESQGKATFRALLYLSILHTYLAWGNFEVGFTLPTFLTARFLVAAGCLQWGWASRDRSLYGWGLFALLTGTAGWLADLFGNLGGLFSDAVFFYLAVAGLAILRGVRRARRDPDFTARAWVTTGFFVVFPCLFPMTYLGHFYHGFPDAEWIAWGYLGLYLGLGFLALDWAGRWDSPSLGRVANAALFFRLLAALNYEFPNTPVPALVVTLGLLFLQGKLRERHEDAAQRRPAPPPRFSAPDPKLDPESSAEECPPLVSENLEALRAVQNGGRALALGILLVAWAGVLNQNLAPQKTLEVPFLGTAIPAWTRLQAPFLGGVPYPLDLEPGSRVTIHLELEEVRRLPKDGVYHLATQRAEALRPSEPPPADFDPQRTLSIPGRLYRTRLLSGVELELPLPLGQTLDWTFQPELVWQRPVRPRLTLNQGGLGYPYWSRTLPVDALSKPVSEPLERGTPRTRWSDFFEPFRGSTSALAYPQ